MQVQSPHPISGHNGHLQTSADNEKHMDQEATNLAKLEADRIARRAAENVEARAQREKERSEYLVQLAAQAEEARQKEQA